MNDKMSVVEKKKAPSAVDKKKALQAFMNNANKSAKGRRVLAHAVDVPNTFLLRRPSGIMQLDIDTGGGLPAGGLSYLSGPDNAGKTFLLWKYFAMQQRLYGSACCLGYAAVEAAPDYFFARKCGVKIAIPDEMIDMKSQQRKEVGLAPFTKGELTEFRTQVGEVIIFRGLAETILDNVLGGIESNLFNILAVDSVTALQPESDDKLSSVGDFGQQGANASVVTKFMKKYCPLTVGLDGINTTSLVFTAQVRSNRKKSELPGYMAKWEQDWATTGAYSARHTKLLDVTIWSGPFEKKKDSKTDSKYVIGKTLNWKISKGKAGTHDGITGETELYYDKPEEDLSSILSCGLRYGAILEMGGFLTVPGLDVGTLNDPNHFYEKLREFPSLELAIRQRVLAAARIECIYK